ncbi:MAG: hypothetical protein ACK5ZJ_02095 [Acidobacteriota bacterium]
MTGEEVTYQFDELERLIAAQSANTAWGLSQTVTKGTGPQSVQIVNPQNNLTQMPQPGGSLTLNYDSSNRVSSLQSPNGSESYVYAPDNRRIWRSSGAFCPNGLTFYSPSGQKLGTYSFVSVTRTPSLRNGVGFW